MQPENRQINQHHDSPLTRAANIKKSPQDFSQSLKTFTKWKNPIYSLTHAQKRQNTNVFFPDTAGSRTTEVDGNDQIGKRATKKKCI